MKAKYIAISIFVLLVLSGLWSCWSYQKKATLVLQYQESHKAIENPARGFYTQIAYKEEERLKEVREYGHTLALVTMSLGNNMESEIPEEKIERLRVLLQEARKQEVMLLFRAAYRQNEEMGEPELALIKTHIQQLSQVLNEYKDVVLVVQTGMIGLWGEWHGSVFLEDEDALENEAMKVVEWWLEYLDPSINLNLRRPYFIQTALELGMDGSRIGMHNDALLATENDLGTYIERTEDLAWCQQNLNGKVNGGEMPYISRYTEIENALKEFDQLSLMYLNAHYNVEVLEEWEEQEYSGENALEYIEEHLGYRYFVKEIETTKTIYPSSEKLNIVITLGNSGFSTIHNRFKLYLVLDDGVTKRFVLLQKEMEEKSIEQYQCTVEILGDRPFEIGLCYSDDVDLENNCVTEYGHTVQLANDEIRYKDGINYVFAYQYKDDEREELVPWKYDE